MRNCLLAALLATMLTGFAAAQDPALDARVDTVSQELRCLVCQNQTIADSQADLAVDLRRQVREMLIAGKSEAEVVRYMTERYGDFVVYRPPVRTDTLLLWFGPLILLVLGIALLLRRIRKLPEAATLANDDRIRANKLLDGKD